MDEPLKKKFKLGDRTNLIDVEFEQLQFHLLSNCLCKLPSEVLRKVTSWFRLIDSVIETIPNWSVDRVLLLVTDIHLMCEMTIRHFTQGSICPRLNEVKSLLAQPENKFANFLLYIADIFADNDFILYASCKALTLLLLIIDLNIDPVWLDKMVEDIEESNVAEKVQFSLDVLKGIIEWKEFDEHTLEDFGPEDKIAPTIICKVQSVEADQIDSTDLKSLCVKCLGQKWPSIMMRFHQLIKYQYARYQSSIITFLSLWQYMVSIKANLSVSETEPFLMNLACYVPLLSASTTPIIWKQLISLFNEVMCYGNTLSLQKNLQCHDYPCKLAHMVVRNMKDRQLLNLVPYKDGNDMFGGYKSGEGDQVLLKKIGLMILKAVAITVEETKYDSCSESSASSEMEDGDSDMALIGRSIHDVLKKLDHFMKTHSNFHPETKPSQWLVQLFIDQDDYLFESMLCCLDVCTGLCYRNNSIPDLLRNINPSVSFVHFLENVVYDAVLLVDYLISKETCFLLYFYRLLKHLRRNPSELAYACDKGQLSKVHKLLGNLRSSIERLVQNKLFPYNISPVIKQLKLTEESIQQYSSCR